MEPIGRSRVSDVARIESELAELWRSAADGDDAVTRACTRNLVLVCDRSSEALESASRLVARISEATPGRAIVIAASPPDDGDRPLDAWVSAHCHRVRSDGPQVCSEQITIRATAEGMELVPETVLQLLVEEMPVHVVWSRPRLFDDPLVDPLMDLADQFIVDGSIASDPDRFIGELHRLAVGGGRPGRVADVAWARLDPWLEAVASFFDAPSNLPALEGIEALRIAAGRAADSERPATSAAYVAGWLASRLGWSAHDADASWRRADGDVVRIEIELAAGAPPGRLARVELEAAAGGRVTRFTAELGAQRAVRLRETPSEGAPHERGIVLPERDLAALVCGMLQQGEPDPLYGDALEAAARMVRG